MNSSRNTTDQRCSSASAKSLNVKAGELFESWFGVSISEVNAHPEIIPELREKFSHTSPRDPRTENHYGRGHVGFGRSVSALDADLSTLEMISNW